MDGRTSPLTAVRELTHTPDRSFFDCLSCGETWPCAPAKAELSEQFKDDRVSLAIFMGGYLYDALEAAFKQHDWPKVDNMYERFLGWTRGNSAHPVAD